MNLHPVTVHHKLASTNQPAASKETNQKQQLLLTGPEPTAPPYSGFRLFVLSYANDSLQLN